MISVTVLSFFMLANFLSRPPSLAFLFRSVRLVSTNHVKVDEAQTAA
jgi:hypothetical protein